MRTIFKTFMSAFLITSLTVSLASCSAHRIFDKNTKNEIRQSDVIEVTTDFKAFEVAFEMVCKENSGFNTFGWNTGDNAGGIMVGDIIQLNGRTYIYTNADKDAGDRICNEYDEGDFNLNGVKDDGEEWTGIKVFTETWTQVYSLNHPTNSNDKSAYEKLEAAINSCLGISFKIDLLDDGTFTTNQKDPWGNLYHGVFTTNALKDAQDRGAFVLISDGPDKICNTRVAISNGQLSIDSSKDFYLSTIYTNANGKSTVISDTKLPERTDK